MSEIYIAVDEEHFIDAVKRFGYVPERVCHVIGMNDIETIRFLSCGHWVGLRDNFCPKCGARIEE